MADHFVARPEAGWKERAAVAVPIVHRYFDSAAHHAALPTGRAWRQAILGEAVGIAAVLLVAHTYGPTFRT